MCLKCWKCIFSQSQDTNFQNYLGEHAPRVLDSTRFAGLLVAGGENVKSSSLSDKCQVNSFPEGHTHFLMRNSSMRNLCLTFHPVTIEIQWAIVLMTMEKKENHETFSTEHEAQS